MTLSDKFKAFEEPTMIVVTDNVRAKLFLAKDRDVELVGMISKEADNIVGEREAVVTGAGDMRSGEQDPENLKWSREQLYAALSPELMKRLQAGEFERLALCAPQEDMNEMKESLHIDLLKRTDAYVEKNLCNDELPDIILHVQMAE
jgi:protein required for attachment to host cells